MSTSAHRSSRSMHLLEVIEKNQCKTKLWSGDSGLPEMTTKSSVRPTLIVNGSVLLRISKSTHRRSRSTHSLEVIEKNQCKTKLWSGDSGLPEMTTKSSVRPTLIVNGSVSLRISKSTHRRSRSTHSLEVIEKNQCKTKLWSGDSGFPEMTTKSSVRPTLIVNGSVLLRISKSTHRRSRSTHSLEVIEKNQCKTKLWSGDSGLPEMTTKSSVRPILIVNGSVSLRISKSTHRSSRSTHSLEVIEKNQCKTKLWSGDSGLPEMTTKSSVRPTLIVNGSVSLRISKSTHRRSRSTHSLEVIEKNQCKTKLWSGDSGLPEMTTKSSVRPTLIVNGSVLLRISKSTHRRSRSTHSLENEIVEWGYSPTHDDNISGPTVTELNCGVGWGYSPTRDDNISGPTVTGSWGYSPTRDDNISGPTVTGSLLVQSCFEFRRVRIAVLSVNILRRIKLWSGDTQLRETTTKSSVRPTLTINGSVLLRISKNTHRSSRSAHSPRYIIITRSFNILYDLFRFRIKLWSGDTELRETTTKSSVRPTLTVIGSVLLRISKSTHRSSRSAHSPQVIEKNSNCEVGILSCEKEQQRRSFDRLLQLLVQLYFGLRRGNLEKFRIKLRNGDTRFRGTTTMSGLWPTFIVPSSVVLWTSTRELRKISCIPFLQLLTNMGILACERGKQRRSFDRLLQLLVQLCFGLRRVNLEIFSLSRDLEIFALLTDFNNLSPRKFSHFRGTENLSSRMDLEIFSLSRDFENLSPRVDLEIFALAED
ncbi:hypothetical protein V1477_020194 [Vespula maculifrons]|uniref:Uncharacterized protein n=1 Tax=Vespula maculifrons TaxID=7453 RepID=A0ABD2AL82_VESMC